MNLATTTSPWNTSLTFNFFDKVSTFRFLVSTVVLEELSPSSYSGSTAGKNFGVTLSIIMAFSTTRVNQSNYLCSTIAYCSKV